MKVGGQQMTKLCSNAHVDYHINFPVPQKYAQMWQVTDIHRCITNVTAQESLHPVVWVFTRILAAALTRSVGSSPTVLRNEYEVFQVP